MGLSIDSTAFLLQGWRDGVRFTDTLTLGRQHLTVSPQRLERLMRQYGAWPPPSGAAAFRRECATASWRFGVLARALGAQRVSACDASAYEAADLLHDLNQPIPVAWHDAWDVVIDGGTLEHVFNFPGAIANCMRWVKPGGHLVLFTPANNFFGHGFYQFSPELFYRTLAPAHGFTVRRMVALADAEGLSSLGGVPYTFPLRGPWHAVADPAQIGSRVTLINRHATLLYVLAQRTGPVPDPIPWPQQSDYTAQWQQPARAPRATAGLAAWLQRRFSERFCRETLPRLALLLDPLRVWRFRRAHSFRQRRFFRRLPPP